MNDGWETCSLCGIVGMPTAIGVLLAKWQEPVRHDGKPYGSIVRCFDPQACRDRFPAGKVWPLDDKTVPTQAVALKVVSHPMDLPNGAGTDAEPDPDEVARWLS